LLFFDSPDHSFTRIFNVPIVNCCKDAKHFSERRKPSGRHVPVDDFDSAVFIRNDPESIFFSWFTEVFREIANCCDLPTIADHCLKIENSYCDLPDCALPTLLQGKCGEHIIAFQLGCVCFVPVKKVYIRKSHCHIRQLGRCYHLLVPLLDTAFVPLQYLPQLAPLVTVYDHIPMQKEMHVV
jgi:hypothetical protein